MVQQALDALALVDRTPPVNGRSRISNHGARLIYLHLPCKPESTHPQTHTSQLAGSNRHATERSSDSKRTLIER